MKKKHDETKGKQIVMKRDGKKKARLTTVEMAMQKQRKDRDKYPDKDTNNKLKQEALEGVSIDLYQWSNQMKKQQDIENNKGLEKKRQDESAEENLPTTNHAHIELTTVEDLEELTTMDYVFIILHAIFYFILLIGLLIGIQILIRGTESFTTAKADKTVFIFIIGYMAVSGIALINWFAKNPSTKLDQNDIDIFNTEQQQNKNSAMSITQRMQRNIIGKAMKTVWKLL